MLRRKYNVRVDSGVEPLLDELFTNCTRVRAATGMEREPISIRKDRTLVRADAKSGSFRLDFDEPFDIVQGVLSVEWKALFWRSWSG